MTGTRWPHYPKTKSTEEQDLDTRLVDGIADCGLLASIVFRNGPKCVTDRNEGLGTRSHRPLLWGLRVAWPQLSSIMTRYDVQGAFVDTSQLFVVDLNPR